MSDSSETPLQTSSTSIHNLKDDILIYIFTLNADMFAQKYALYTTHITSHVCRQWRDLLLGASYLWARLIDLDLLCNDWHHVWRNEIIRRSEGAPLWIRFESERISYRKDHGAISAPTEYISEFFCRIVKENWHRIQRLVVYREDWNSVIYSMLCYPAPYLQNLTVPLKNKIVKTEDSGEDSSIRPIFSDYAPFLRRLSLKGYNVHYQAPWLKQLHILELVGEYDVRDILAVLSATPSLREVRLELRSQRDMTSPIPEVSLPSLERMELHFGLHHLGVTFLNHVEIPVDCFLLVYAIYIRRPPTTSTEYLPLINLFTHYAQRLLQSHQSNIITINYARSRQISLKCTSMSPLKCCIWIHILIPEDIRSTIFEIALTNLSCPELSSVSEVHFSGWGNSVNLYSASNWVFLEGLTSLHTLCCNSRLLPYLTRTQEETNTAHQRSIALPSLSTLNLKLYNSSLDNITVDNETAAFFLARLQNGYPLPTLNLSLEHSDVFSSRPNLDSLEGVKGLKVTYKLAQSGEISEYICGSGDLIREEGGAL